MELLKDPFVAQEAHAGAELESNLAREHVAKFGKKMPHDLVLAIRIRKDPAQV